MLFRPRDFIPAIEKAFASGKTPLLRSISQWHVPGIAAALEDDTSFALIADYAAIDGSNTLSWRPTLLVTRRPFRTHDTVETRNNMPYNIRGTSLVYDAEADRILNEKPYGIGNLHQMLTENASQEAVLEALFPNLAGKVEHDRQYDSNWTLQGMSYYSSLEDLKKLRDNVLKALTESIDHRLREERNPEILQASHDEQVRKKLAVLVGQQITREMILSQRGYFNAPNQHVMDYLRVNRTQPLALYNIAAEGKDDYEREQRIELLLSTFSGFLHENTSRASDDLAGGYMLQEVSNGLTPAAAIAKVLKIRPQTVNAFVKASPPKRYRLLIKRSEDPYRTSSNKARRNRRHSYQTSTQPRHEAWRDLVIALDDVPAELWPQGHAEWFAFHRLHDNLGESAEALPARLGIVMAAMGQKERNNAIRWHLTENRFLSQVTNTIHGRQQEKTRNHMGKPDGKTIAYQYWEIDYNADGKIEGIDYQYTRMQNILAHGYNKFFNLPFRTKVELIESYNPDGPQPPASIARKPDQGPRHT